MSQLPAYQLPQGAASTIAAAGTTQGTSAQLVANTYQAITSGSGGVAWPVLFQTGQSITVVNETSLAINIYPSQASSSVVIDAIAVNTPYILPAYKSVKITPLSGTQLYSSELSDLLPETSVTVASATSTPIGNSGSRYVKVSGTTTITSFDTVDNGITRDVEFTGILTLTNGANLVLPSGANITTAVGDTARFKCEGGSPALWRCLSYNPASGKAVVQPSGSVTAATVAAAGSVQSTATGITNTNSYVTSSTAGSAQGVALPVAIANGEYIISNQTANSVYVYPVNGGSAAINGLSANAAYILSPYGSATFTATSSTQWYTSNEKNPIVATYYCSTSTSTNSGVQYNFDTKVVDTHSAVTTASAGSSGTWKFTAPRPGSYTLDAWLQTSTNLTVYLYKNGSAFKSFAYMQTTELGSGIGSILLAQGDIIDIRPGTNGTLSGNASLSSNLASWIDIVGI
jgi:hypothetical protein